MRKNQTGLVHWNIPHQAPAMHGSGCKQWSRIASDDLLLHDRARSNRRKWSAIPALMAIQIGCVLVHRDVTQSLRIEPMNSAFGGNDTRLDLRPGLVPAFPRATRLGPIRDAILILDSIDQA